MSEVIKPVPEFEPTEILPAIEDCIDNGVAKVRGLLSEYSIEKLKKRVNYGYDEVLVADSVIGDIPELLAVKELFFSGKNVNRGISFCISGYSFEPTSSSMGISSHTDSHPSTKGLTLLLPVTGNNAIFAASSTRFDLSIDTFRDDMTTSFPQFATEYGPGDGLFLRQTINSINGEQVELKAMHHCGAADTDRHIVALDVIADDLALVSLQTLAFQ